MHDSQQRCQQLSASYGIRIMSRRMCMRWWRHSKLHLEDGNNQAGRQPAQTQTIYQRSCSVYCRCSAAVEGFSSPLRKSVGILAKGWVGTLGLAGRSDHVSGCHSWAFIFACELQQPPGTRTWRFPYLQVLSDMTHVTWGVYYTACQGRSVRILYSQTMLHGQPSTTDSYCCCRLGHHRRS